MPQIQINGELREVSQAEYDALTTNGQASTPASGSYEQYAAARAKEQAVTQLAAGDAALGESTNVSPEFQQELSNIRTNADAAAGTNKDAYAAQYAQEQQSLYTNAPYSREALQQELSAPPPTTQPGTVGVGVPQQQGTDGQVVGTLNTNIPGLSQPTGSIVSSPVRGLTDGGLTTGSPAAGIESAPSYPTEDPQIPPPSTEGAGEFQRPAPPPDAAFLAEQAQQENRWTQAAATNPEGINQQGSVVIDRGDGSRETINRDGSYEISNADGTFRYDAAGQETSYTTPTVNGVSVTTTADGVQYTRVQQGPLTTETITNNGEPISTTVSYDVGATRLTGTETVGGQPVYVAETALGDGTIDRTVVSGEDTTSEQVKLESKQAVSQAEQQAIAENQQLREDLIAAKEKTLAGQELTASETQALEQQAQAAAVADAELAQAQQTLAETDPTVVPAGEDPQVDTFVDPVQDPLPSLDSTNFDASPVSPEQDPEALATDSVQAEQEVSAAAVEEAPPEISAEQDPQVPSEEPEISLAEIEEAPPEISIVQDPQVPTEEPIVPLADIDSDPLTVSQDDPQLPEEIATFSGDLVEIEPEPVDPDTDPEVFLPESEFVAASDIETDAPEVDNFQEYLEEEQFDPLVEEFEPQAVTDTGGVPTQSLADIDGDTGFVPLEDPVDIPPGFSPYGEEDEPFDPDFVTEPDNALFTEEYIQDQDNPVELPEEQDDGISPYGEQDEPFDPVPVTDPFEVDGANLGLTEEEIQDQDNPRSLGTTAPDPYEVDGAGIGLTEEEIQEQDNPTQTAAARQQATLDQARAQAARQAQLKQSNDGDWRVKLRLAPGANYLYRANDGKGSQAGIMQPLAVTDGVVFPYTPQIQTVYKANYSAYELTHSNYRGFFYQGSYVDDINITATFTAQDTAEANYLLAVIHFFRSITKMFYGQDAQRGAPPPLVFLQGLGEYQFNLHPCVVAQFNYSLPNDVDYIRARSVNVNGTNLLARRDRQTVATNPFSSAWDRLSNAGLRKGAITAPPAPPTLGTQSPTYVPTKIDITLLLHPIQSREQVSKQFSLKQFANGDLLKGGFW